MTPQSNPQGGRLRKQRKLLLFIFVLLMAMAVSLPAYAAITSYTALTDNPTIYAQADYDLQFSTTTGLSVGDDVYLDFSTSPFHVTGVVLNDVTMTVNGVVYQATAVRQQDNDKILIITVPINVNPDENATIKIKGVENNPDPTISHNFARLSTSREPGVFADTTVQLTVPTLAITPEHNTIEVYLRDRLKVELRDSKNQPLPAPFDVNVRYFTDSAGGEFYPDPANAYQIDYWGGVTIPQGSSSVDVYYRPMAVGTRTVTAAANYWGMTAASPAITVTPAQQVNSRLQIDNLTGYPGVLTAGVPGKFQVKVIFTDQYGNPVPRTQDLPVNITAVQPGGAPANGRLLMADGAKGEVLLEPWQDLPATVIIPKDRDYLTFYYVDTKATRYEVDQWGNYRPTGYNVIIKATAAGFKEGSSDVEIKPDKAQVIKVVPGGAARVTGEPFNLGIQLFDQYGNPANWQPYTGYNPTSLSVDLKTTSPTGKFFADPFLENQISQITYPADVPWWTGDGQAKTVYYADPTAGDVTVSAATYYLQEGSANLKVLALPDSVGLSTAMTDWVLKHRGKVTVSLLNADGSPYLVPNELPGGLSVLLNANPDGKFYTEPVDGRELEIPYEYSYGGRMVNIPAGKSSVDVYYAPDNAGKNRLTATMFKYGAVKSGKLEFDILPTGGVRLVLSGPLSFPAGQAGKVTVCVKDQYGNPVNQTSDLVVNLSVTQFDGASVTGKVYAALVKETAPGQKVDIIWVLDNSGSMGDDQASVANNIIEFSDRLAASGLDYQMGFLQYVHDVRPYVFSNGTSFTSNVEEFKQALLAASNNTYGGTEYTMQAVQAALNYPFRGDAEKHIIIVTDEPGDDNPQRPATEAAARAQGARVHAIWNMYEASYSEIDELANNTGGVQAQIGGNWSATLGIIAGGIVEQTEPDFSKEITQVVIPAGKSCASFYYCDTTSTQGTGYSVVIKASADNLENDQTTVTINPLAAKKVAIKPANGIYHKPGDRFQLDVLLQDKFGNPASPQQTPLTVELETTSETGRFYRDYWLNERITQLTFWSGWDGYNYPQNPQTIYYTDSTGGEATVSAWTYTVEKGSAQLKVLAPPFLPASVGLSTTEPGWLVNQRGKVTVTLLDGSGNPYTVPEELSYGLDVLLEASPYGHFYTDLVGGYERWYHDEQWNWYYGYGINIPAGASSVDLYYAPAEPGENILTAGLAGYSEVAAGELKFDVAPAGGVRVVFADECLCFTAGQAGKVTVTVRDQYGNEVKQEKDLVVELYTKTQNGLPSPTGAFYSSIKDDGTPGGNPVTSITIPAGSVSADVYYYDTKATGPDYELFLGLKALPVNGSLRRADVYPADSNRLQVVIRDYEDYGLGRIDVVNGFQALLFGSGTGQGKVQHNLLNGAVFPMTVSIVDKQGNPVPQSSRLTVNLATVSGTVYGKFYLDQERRWPVTQIHFGPGYYYECDGYGGGGSAPDNGSGYYDPDHGGVVNLFFAAEGTGAANVTAKAPGLIDGNFEINVADPDRLSIHCHPVEDNPVPPGVRKDVAILFTDGQGHQARTRQDITVNLSILGGGEFFADPESGEPINSAVIPKGYEGVVVFYQAPDTEGTATLEATADGLIKATRDVVIKWQPIYKTSLRIGWNTLSAPLELQRSALDQVLEKFDYLQIAYTYEETQGKWVQVYKDGNTWRVNINGSFGSANPEFRLEPLKAVYVKLKGATAAAFYPYAGLSGPYSRQVKAGWNLIGPAIDLSFTDKMKASEVLSSINGKYSQVFSPGMGFQDPWAYVPGAFSEWNVPWMRAGCGYWLFMKEDGTLAGYSYTPVKKIYNPGQPG